jgi:hypothetical protein
LFATGLVERPASGEPDQAGGGARNGQAVCFSREFAGVSQAIAGFAATKGKAPVWLADEAGDEWVDCSK